jgi:hypothetical protein
MVLLLVGSIQMLSHFRNVPIGKASRFLLLSNKTDTSHVTFHGFYLLLFIVQCSIVVRVDTLGVVFFPILAQYLSGSPVS